MENQKETEITAATGINENNQVINDNNPTENRIQLKEFRDDDTAFMERPGKEEELSKKWEILTRKRLRKEVIYAKVVSGELIRQRNTVNIRLSLSGDFTAVVPDKEFFEDKIFKEDYEMASESEKAVRRMEKARACLGAWVPMVIEGMERTYNGHSHEYAIVASRKHAMELRRQRYFEGDGQVKEGDIIKSEVLSVGEHYVNVEALGVECSLRKDAIDAFTYISDCRDVITPGEKLLVRVMQIHRNEDGSIRMKVSGSQVGYPELMENTRNLRMGSCHEGIVKSYNRLRDTYTVITSTKAMVFVPANWVTSMNILSPGDRVTVTVTRRIEDMALGTAQKR